MPWYHVYVFFVLLLWVSYWRTEAVTRQSHSVSNVTISHFILTRSNISLPCYKATEWWSIGVDNRTVDRRSSCIHQRSPEMPRPRHNNWCTANWWRYRGVTLTLYCSLGYDITRIRGSDVTESMGTIRSPFCGYNAIKCVELNGEDLSCMLFW